MAMPPDYEPGPPEPGRDERRVASMLEQVPEQLHDDVQCWIAALRGEGRRPSPALGWLTIRVYLNFALPVLREWGTRYGALREVTRDDVATAIREHPGNSPHNVHTALRSLFRGLKRERRIFTDPAARVTAHFARRIPRPLPADRLRGLLDRLDNPRERLITALVAVHALGVGELQAAQLQDLDRGRGTLQIHRQGLVFTVVLDEVIVGMINDWLRTRATTWPRTGNPFLFVSSYTVGGREPMSRYGLTTPFRTLGISARQLRVDRILDFTDRR
jgi:integrase